jgi:hypothetical protein
MKTTTPIKITCLAFACAMLVSLATTHAAVILNSGVDGTVYSRSGRSAVDFTGPTLDQYGLSDWEWSRSFAKFDLSSLSPGTPITSATLRLTVTAAWTESLGITGATNDSSQVTQVFQEGVNWTTGATWSTSNGTTAWPSYDTYPNIDYSVYGGYYGLDFPLASTTIATGFTGTVDFNVTMAVQSWLAGGSNYGFFLKTGPTIFGVPGTPNWNITMGSFNNPNASDRPQLILEVVPEPSTWALVAGGVSTLLIFRRRKQS